MLAENDKFTKCKNCYVNSTVVDKNVLIIGVVGPVLMGGAICAKSAQIGHFGGDWPVKEGVGQNCRKVT